VTGTSLQKTHLTHYITQPHRLYPNKGLHPRVVGEKMYELTDHLGNVRTTITDRKIATFDSNWLITGFTADITSANDYFPFGSEMPGRSYNSGEYRYGFNGMEKDDEVKGTGNSYDFGARIYDSRIGRWLSTDPKENRYPDISSFVYSLDNPILYIDPNGKEVYVYGADSKATVEAIGKKTSLQLKYDASTNQISVMGDPKTDFDKALVAAIKDPNIKVNLHTTRENIITSKSTGKKGYLEVGAFDGSYTQNIMTYDSSKDSPAMFDDGRAGVGSKSMVVAEQWFNIKHAEIEESAGGNSVGTNASHEIIEAYFGARDSPGASSPISGNPSDQNAYINAHEKAVGVDPSFKHSEPSSSPSAGPGVINVGGVDINLYGGSEDE